MAWEEFKMYHMASNRISFQIKFTILYFIYTNMESTQTRLRIPVNSTCLSLELSEQNICFGCSTHRSLSTFCKKSTNHRNTRTQCKEQWKMKACQKRKGLKALMPKARKFYLSTWKELDVKEYKLPRQYLQVKRGEKKGN